MKQGDLVKIINPLPKRGPGTGLSSRGQQFDHWLHALSRTGMPVPLVSYREKSTWCQILHDGEIKAIGASLVTMYESR